MGGREEGRNKIWMKNMKMKMLLNQIQVQCKCCSESLSCDFYLFFSFKEAAAFMKKPLGSQT